MYNLPKYRFILSFGETEKGVYPIYGDIEKEKSKEDNQEFFRTKWKGKLTFILTDYDLINDAAFDTIFKLEVLARNFETGIFENDYNGRFVKTDLEFFNGDNGNPEKVVLKNMDTDDKYRSVLDGLPNEYNLISLNPEISTMNYVNRPLLQFYIANGLHVLNVLGGTYWELEVEPTDDDLYLDGAPCYFKKITVTDTVNGVEESVIVYARVLHNVEDLESQPDWPTLPGYNNYEIGEGDLVGAEVMGYKYVTWLEEIVSIGDLRDEFQDESTFLGKVSKGCGYNTNKYYSQAQQSNRVIINGEFVYPDMIPLNKKQWGCFSIWVNYSIFERFYRKEPVYNGVLNTDYVYPYTYKLSEVIKVLLTEIDPSITHEFTPEYSKFFYSNDQNNIINGDQYAVFITPKSNFISKDADEPAVRAIITLEDLLKDLKSIYKVAWYIDDENRFRLEHVSWYDNGGSYSGSPNIQIDLTNLWNNRSRKNWDFQQNNITYEKQDLAGRYHFQWSEEVTPVFTGYPIRIISNYIQQGKKEDIYVNKFTTDVEYMIANSGSISPEGFVMFAGIVKEEGNLLIGNDSTMNGPNYWYANDIDIFDVNTSYAGKLYAEFNKNGSILAADESRIFVTMDGFTFPNTYDVKFKCKRIGGVESTLDIDTGELINQGTPEAEYVKIPFTPTTIEETYEFKNVLAPGIFFAIRLSEGNPFINATFDDVEIYKSDNYYMPIKEIVINNKWYSLQNLDLSWVFLHQNYWRHSLPAPDIIINESPSTALSLKRNKVQVVRFPYLTDPNNLELIKTSVGNGEIRKLVISLLSRMIKATLNYDTE